MAGSRAKAKTVRLKQGYSSQVNSRAKSSPTITSLVTVDLRGKLKGVLLMTLKTSMHYVLIFGSLLILIIPKVSNMHPFF